MVLDKKDYVQVLEVLKNFKSEDQKKVPEDLLDLLRHETNDCEYTLILNKKIPLENQISRQAMGCIIYIVTKYIANNKEKEILKKILIDNTKEFQESANIQLEKLIYSNDNKKTKNIESNIPNLPIEIKTDNFIKKIINKIKKFFSNRR